MKITFVIPFLHLFGGIRRVCQYANSMQRRGHQVTVTYPLVPMKFGAEWCDLDRLYQQAFSALGNLKKGNRISWFPLETPLQRAMYFPERCKIPLWYGSIPDADIVVATAWPTAYLVHHLGKEKGKKFYFIQHYEVPQLWNEPTLWERAKKAESDPYRLPSVVANLETSSFYFHKHRTLVDGSYRLPLHQITISSWLKNLIEEKFNRNVESLIINFIDFTEFFNESKRCNDTKRILMSYHEEKWKGMEDGLKAFEIARQKHPEIQLVMFAPHRGSNVPSHAEFHENPSAEELRRIYCSGDIFVWPSWVEGFGAPPTEAMACKCAVVSTSTGGIPDCAIPEGTALVCPPRSPETLAENIIRLLDDETLLSRISEAGYEHIKSFTQEKATREMEQAFQEALARKTP